MRIFILFFLVSCTAHWLAASWWLSTLAKPVPPRKRRVVIGSAIGLSLFLVGARTLVVFQDTAALRAVVAVAMTELAVVLLALVPLGLLSVLLRGAERIATIGQKPAAKLVDRPEPTTPLLAKPRVTRRQALEGGLGISIFGATSTALGWGLVRGRHAFELEEVAIRIAGWPRALDGYTIAQVSDVHVGTFVGERELREGFELVSKIRPDLIVATGDLVDFDATTVGALALQLLRINARDGAHAVLGNHDHFAGAASVARRLEAAGVSVLSNRSALLREGDGGGFALVGVDDLQGRARAVPGFRGPDLNAALRGVTKDVPRILLAHQPPYIREAAGRVALQLSGHTHGGQINPGFRPADFLMDYVAGRYELGGTSLYVNRGFGVAGLPSRIGAPPEVTKIVIVAG